MNTIEKIYELYLKCNQNISTDSRSRNIQNSIFFGINGKNFNGNHFANDAIKKGASFAIIDEDIDTQLPNIIKVDNSLYALQELAKKHRSYWGTDSNSKIIIGITGTNGKTTTKELLKNIISSEKKVCCTEGNQNNHIGVPLTILKLRKQHDIGIIELGANHIGEIKTLCLIANPTHGIITNIGEAHLEGFKNITNIINTKNELYNHIKQNNGVIFFNTLDSVLLNLIGTYQKVIPYKIIELNNTIKKTETDLYFECALFIKLFWFNNIIKTKIPGNYNAQNIAASIRIAQYLNISIKNITDTLKVLELKNNRSQFIDTGKNKIILDAYNANPTSASLAIDNFIKFSKEYDSKHKLIILGDMLELGEKSKQYHQKIINLLEKYNIENCILVGACFQETKCTKKYKKLFSVDEFENLIKENTIKNSAILIKGSRKMQLEKIITLL